MAAQIRVRVPCWPTRASSCQQSSIGLPRACSGIAAATRAAKFFYAPPGLPHRVLDAVAVPTAAESPAGVATCPRCAHRAARRTAARSPRPDRPAASAPRHASQGRGRCAPTRPLPPSAPALAAACGRGPRNGSTGRPGLPRCSGGPNRAASADPSRRSRPPPPAANRRKSAAVCSPRVNATATMTASRLCRTSESQVKPPTASPLSHPFRALV